MFMDRSTEEGEFQAMHSTEIDYKAEKVKKLTSVTQMTDLEEVF